MRINEIITENTQGVSEGTDDFSRNVATFRLYQHLDPMEFYNMARTPQGLAMLAKKAGTTPESVKDSLERLDWGQFPADFYQDDEEQDVAEGQLEEIDRRGFLKGLGAAAMVGAAGGAMAQSKPTDMSAELSKMTKDDPRIQYNKDVNDLARAIYERMVAERGQPMDRRQQNNWMAIARTKAEARLSQYAPGKQSATKPSAGFPSQPSEYRRSPMMDKDW